MIIKTLKYGAIATIVLVVGTWLVLGSDVFGYAKTKALSWRQEVRDSVPVELELQRARELLDEIVPEIHANIRIIATEEVELANLKEDITRTQEALDTQQARISKFTELMSSGQVYFTFGERQYSRQQIKIELANRFERFKEAQMVLESKRRLLAAREKSLHAAMDMLANARAQKELLAEKIAALDSQNRLLIAASAGSDVHLDDSKLARTAKLIARIQKRLDVSERILAHEGRFVESIDIDVVDEVDLLSEIDDYFSPEEKTEALTSIDIESLPAPAGSR